MADMISRDEVPHRRGFFSRHSFSARLLLGVFILILLTTASAGIPAYGLTRTQLERQAWSQVEGAQRATRSLLLSEQEQLNNLTTLFAERPTLQRLVREQANAELDDYLEAFQRQSQLDLLHFCDANGQSLAGNTTLADCSHAPDSSFTLAEGRPAIVVRQAVADETSGQILGVAVAGAWLDQPFLQQLASDTGVQQSIVAPDGVHLASSLANVDQSPPERGDGAALTLERQPIQLLENLYYAACSELPDTSEAALLVSEVALPVVLRHFLWCHA